MNKSISFAFIILLIIVGCKRKGSVQNRNIENTDENIVFAVPFAPVSYPVFKMLEDSVFKQSGRKTELLLWSTPDQLKALIIGGKADFFAVPSNTAATFYNKGVNVKLLNISIWRLLWMVSSNPDKKSLADFKGEEIAMPFKGDMPHIVFSELVRAQGFDPEKDFNLVFESTPMDAAQKLIMRRIENAVLVDPAASMVLQKSKSGPVKVVAPDLYRAVDFQQEWSKVFNTKREIPFAGMVAGESILKDTVLVQDFIKAYSKATEWCMKHPVETAELAVKYVPQLNKKGVEEAMRNVMLKSVRASEARPKLEQFYGVLLNSRPALVGERLPDEEFYY